MPVTVRSEFAHRYRPKLARLYSNVNGYESSVSYIAHWLMPVEDDFIAFEIGSEMDPSGLESNPTKHPDQKFWVQKRMTPMPSTESVIVTDCKLLPCSESTYSCAYRVPRLIADRFGEDIPIAVFAHNHYHSGMTSRRLCYYTASGASKSEIDEHVESSLGTWDWE